MDFNSIIAPLDITPAELARRLEISDGHVWDLKGGRRKLSLKIAAKLEGVTGRTDIATIVARPRTPAPMVPS
jgi:plasmid maintenance system antidote protein VapI